MPKLFLECYDKKIKLKKIAAAVYKTFAQKENLKAEIVFVSAEEIRDLNRDKRGINSVTDVLSFPSLDNIRSLTLDAKDYPEEIDGKYLFIGSIVLCEDKIREQAIEYGHSEERERTYLIIHGLSHLFGYDHINEEDKSEMRLKEKEALKLLGIGED